MEPPLASVIVPLFNAQDYVADLVGYLKAQTLDDFEALLFDDGSTDATADRARKAIAGDSRFSLFAGENEGPGAVRNRGIDLARGTYLSFMDGDDVPSKDLLSHAVRRAGETDADIVVFQSRHYDCADGMERPNPDRWNPAFFPPVFDPADHPRRLFGEFRNWPWDKLFSRSFLVDGRIRFPPLRRTEDLSFTCTALASAKRIALLDEELYTYRASRPAASTQNLDKAPLDFIASAIELHRQLEDRGLLSVYAQTYASWVAACICVNLVGLKTATAFLDAYRCLHGGALADLGIESDKIPVDDPDRRVAGQMTEADIAEMISIVESQDAEAGAFEFGRWKAELVRRDYESSRAFQFGRQLARPISRLRAIAKR